MSGLHVRRLWSTSTKEVIIIIIIIIILLCFIFFIIIIIIIIQGLVVRRGVGGSSAGTGSDTGAESTAHWRYRAAQYGMMRDES